jgi:hypothetical protein
VFCLRASFCLPAFVALILRNCKHLPSDLKLI